MVWLNEQGVDISLIRFRTYVAGKPVIDFSRLYPVPDVEAFTIGRRADKDAGGPTDPGAPWDVTALRRLTKQCNHATRTLLDLCAVEEPGEVVVADVVKTAGISVGAVRGQLAGLTMLLKNTTKYGFTQNAWPVTVACLSGGLASYSMDPVLAKIWRTIQSEGETIPPGAAREDDVYAAYEAEFGRPNAGRRPRPAGCRRSRPRRRTGGAERGRPPAGTEYSHPTNPHRSHQQSRRIRAEHKPAPSSSPAAAA